MARNQLKRILGRDDKGASKAYGSGGALVRIWTKMLKDLDVNIARWNDYMHSFVTDPRNGIPPTRKDQTSARGNLTKEFARPQMTWKVFMKALRFLKVVKVEFAIKCHFANGHTSTHGTVVDFGMPTPPLPTTFMEDMSLESSPLMPPVRNVAAIEPVEEPVSYTEEEDDEYVHDFFTLLANPFMFPMDTEEATSEWEPGTPEHPQGNRIYQAWAKDVTNDFDGNIAAQRAMADYLASKRIGSDHEQA